MPIFIPYSNNGSQEINVLFRSFVNDLVDEYGKLFESGKLKPEQAWKKDAVWIKYCSPYVADKDREVADRLSVKRSSEAVRNYALEAFSEEMFEMLDAEKPFMGEIVPTSEMKQAYDRFVSELKPVEHYDLLIRRYGFKESDLSDEKVLNCFLDCLGYEVIGRKDFEPYAILKAQFGRAKSRLVKYISPLKKYLKTDPVPRCYERDVLPFMKGKGWSDDDCDLMTDFLRADEHEYEWSGPDKNKHNWVALRWEALGSENARVERILFDFKENHPNSEGWINLDEIRKEYDRLAIIHRVDPLSRNPNCGGKHTERRGNSGEYRYNLNPKKAKIKLADELKRFVVIKKGLCSLDDALKYAQGIQKCSIITVDLYLRQNGCVSGTLKGKEGKYYCDETCLDQYPDFVRRTEPIVKVSKEEAIRESRDILIAEGRALHITKELVPLFEKKTGKQNINPVSFGNSLRTAEGILFLFPARKGTVELSIPASQARCFDVNAFLNPPTKKETVQNAAAEFLLAAPHYTMTKRALKDELIKAGAFSSNVNVSNLYGYLDDILFDDKGTGKGGSYTLNISEYNRRYGFSDSFNWKTLKEQIVQLVGDPRLNGSVADKMYSIMQNVAVKPFGSSSEMWRILKLVSTYLNGKPSNSEKELLVFKLHLGLEVFLKQYGGDWYSMKMLKDYISILQDRRQLPQENGGYVAGTVEHDIDAMTGEMVRIRNFICHKLNEGYNNPSFYEDRIKKNLKYYLLVAAYAQNNGY